MIETISIKAKVFIDKYSLVLLSGEIVKFPVWSIVMLSGQVKKGKEGNKERNESKDRSRKIMEEKCCNF